MHIYWLEINSVHLNSAKRICPNSWVLESEFLISNINFEKALLGSFPYGAYVSHKIGSQNVHKNSSGLLKGWWSICLTYFFSCFSSMENHKLLSRLFSGNLPAMFSKYRENGVWTKNLFSRLCFCVPMRRFDIYSNVFLIFSKYLRFFKSDLLNGFPNLFIVHSMSSVFGLVNEISLNCMSGLVLLFFIGVLSFKISSHIHDFRSQIGVVILVTPKQELERKGE